MPQDKLARKPHWTVPVLIIRLIAAIIGQTVQSKEENGVQQLNRINKETARKSRQELAKGAFMKKVLEALQGGLSRQERSQLSAILGDEDEVYITLTFFRGSPLLEIMGLRGSLSRTAELLAKAFHRQDAGLRFVHGHSDKTHYLKAVFAGGLIRLVKF